MYLIVLTTADSVFLVGLMLVCLKVRRSQADKQCHFQVDWISYIYCVSLEYVLMTASYVSSWATAFLTIERYMAIAHPLRHVRVCRGFNNRLSTNNFVVWTCGSSPDSALLASYPICITAVPIHQPRSQ